MAKIDPMLLSEISYSKDVFEVHKDKVWQIKENGTRNIIHIKDYHIVGLRSRSNNPTLYQYPELREIKFNFKEGILDGEVCCFLNTGNDNTLRSTFYGGIDQRRSSPNEMKLKHFPVTLVVFDALKIEDEMLIMKPYKYRYGMLLKHLVPSDKLKVAENFSDGALAWGRVVAENQEGLVGKNLNSMYELGKRSKESIKMKNYKQVDIIIEQIEPNPKGTKIFSSVEIDGVKINVEAQLDFDVQMGDKRKIKYLDIVGERMIQPTRARAVV